MKDERKRILKLVEQGKLSVDEALTLIEGLENSSTPKNSPNISFEEKSTFEETKKEESVNHKIHFAKEKIFDFVDTALKKIKDLDLDLNFGHSVEISHIFQHADASMKNLDIELANGSVKVMPWNQNDVRIECAARVYRVENEQEARDQFMKDVKFEMTGDKLRFHSSQKWMKIEATMYIPQANYDRVRVRMFNGPISTEDLAVQDYRAKTANGKINVAGLTGKSLEVETANGQISIQRSKADKLEAETINGAIKLDGDFQFVDLQTFNGNVTCHLNSDRTEAAVVKAATGSIDLFVPETAAIEGEVKTNLGNFHLLLDGIEVLEEKSEVVQKSLRFKSTSVSNQTLKINADTKTGTVTIKKAEAVSSVK